MNLNITGIGVISAAGNNVEENFNSLREGKTGISYSKSLNDYVGIIDISNTEIVKSLGLDNKDYSRTSLIGMIAAKEAWSNNDLHEGINTGIISGTSVGGLDKIEEYYLNPDFMHSKQLKNKLVFDNNRTTEEIARFLNISGYVSTISTACSSGANAILHGARLIRHGILDRVIVGGVDPLTIYNYRGFNSLMIYDKQLCKPFDENRGGLNLGEGAGFLVLENDKSINKTENVPLCRLTGWSNASDAFHQTASSEKGLGAALAMQQAIEEAGLTPKQIDYINTHGTATKNNDHTELNAVSSVFKENVPKFSSTKSFTGHTLAASGAIEAVFSVGSLVFNSVWPNIHFSNPMRQTDLIPQIHFTDKQEIHHVLSNSFGFGGNCTSLVFSKN